MLASTSASLLLACLAGDDGEGKDGSFGAGEEGDGEGEGKSAQSGRILVVVRPAARLDLGRLDPLDHHAEGSRRPGQRGTDPPWVSEASGEGVAAAASGG